MCKDNHEDSKDEDSLEDSRSDFRLPHGWLIEGRRVQDGSPTGRFLQIGTGQWCPQQYATVFPLRQTAIVYAHEFGYSVGHSAFVVRYCQGE